LRVRWALLLAAALIGPLLRAESKTAGTAPSYTASSIVNSASNQPGSVAPNTFITIYGANLARITRALATEDVSKGTLPTALPGASVRVWIGGIAAFLYYVSPNQINVLVPSNLSPGPAELQVQLDSTYGPTVQLTIGPAAPALFQMDATARPGETITLYATGLGDTTPKPRYGEIPQVAARLADMRKLHIFLDGSEIEAWRIQYAGAAPGFGGLYQINIVLPDNLGRDPRIQIAVGDITSPDGIHIPVNPDATGK
jgi:uncharacterized protein (TIGR03437 family)